MPTIRPTSWPALSAYWSCGPLGPSVLHVPAAGVVEQLLQGDVQLRRAWWMVTRTRPDVVGGILIGAPDDDVVPCADG